MNRKDGKPKRNFTQAEVDQLSGLYRTGKYTQRMLAAQFDTSQPTISLLLKSRGDALVGSPPPQMESHVRPIVFLRELIRAEEEILRQAKKKIKDLEEVLNYIERKNHEESEPIA